MHDLDSTLAEDFDWALFPQEEPQVSPMRRWGLRLEVAFVLVVTWMIWPPLGVIVACLASSFKEFRAAHLASRPIPERAAGRICLLFGYAWGLWTLGIMAITALLVLGAFNVAVMHEPEIPSGAIAALLLAPCGFMGAFILTAVGLVLALRSGMRIWIGEGLNQARTLLLGLLILLFAVFGLGPILLLLIASVEWASDASKGFVVLGGLFAVMFVGPVAILIVLDRIGRRILASDPGKYGPQVSSLKKRDA